LNLGEMLVKGLGAPQDKKMAYFWWLLASAQGEELAIRKRDLIERNLSPKQRADAQASSRTWQAKTQ
jgi:TPR repeat protein